MVRYYRYKTPRAKRTRLYDRNKGVNWARFILVVIVIFSLGVVIHKTGWDRVRKIKIINKPFRWNENYNVLLGKDSYIWNINIKEDELKIEFPFIRKIKKQISLPWFPVYEFEYIEPVAIYDGYMVSYDGIYIRKAEKKDSIFSIIKEGKDFDWKNPIVESFMYKVSDFAHLFDTIYVSKDIIKGKMRKYGIKVLFLPSQESEYVDSVVVWTLKNTLQNKKKIKTIDLRFWGQVVLK